MKIMTRGNRVGCDGIDELDVFMVFVVIYSAVSTKVLNGDVLVLVFSL